MKNESSPLHKAFTAAANLLVNFHPQKRPVLWRVMIAQACLSKRIVSCTREAVSGQGVSEGVYFGEEDRKEFDWRQPGDGVGADEILRPFAVAQLYLQKRLKTN